MLFIILAFIADKKIIKQNNEIKIYLLSYISIFFALNICLNLTIMFQSLWLEILPLYIVYRLNIKITNKKIKKELLNENTKFY